MHIPKAELRLRTGTHQRLRLETAEAELKRLGADPIAELKRLAPASAASTGTKRQKQEKRNREPIGMNICTYIALNVLSYIEFIWIYIAHRVTLVLMAPMAFFQTETIKMGIAKPQKHLSAHPQG